MQLKKGFSADERDPARPDHAGPGLQIVPRPTRRQDAASPWAHTVTGLERTLQGPRDKRQGRSLAISAPADDGGAAMLAALVARAAGAGAAVSVIGAPGDAGGPTSLFTCLCAGRAPVLSTSAACALAAMGNRRSTQLDMLERLLRRHARHRPIVLVVVEADGSGADAAWMLAHLPGLLRDAAVTWLHVIPDSQPAEASTTPDEARPRIETAAAVSHHPGATVIGLRPSSLPTSRASGAASRKRMERARFGWQSLTEKEVKVARLIAEGHTNRSAAAALFISTNTVSTHLRSVFSKLDVNSRVQLTRVALRHPPTADPPPGPRTRTLA